MLSEAEVKVLGGPELFVDTGSVINLTCSIRWTPEPPAVTIWYHNETRISFRGPRPGVSLIIDKSDVTTVQLLIMRARLVLDLWRPVAFNLIYSPSGPFNQNNIKLKYLISTTNKLHICT